MPFTMPFTETIGESTIDGLAYLGNLARLSAGAAGAVFIEPFRGRKIRFGRAVHQAMAVGVEAVPIVSLISFFVGTILALQGAYQLRKLGALQLVADAVAIVVTRELGPLMTAIIVIGRSGSAFAAEIGTMKVNEELDALETMALEPVHFLVAPIYRYDSDDALPHDLGRLYGRLWWRGFRRHFRRIHLGLLFSRHTRGVNAAGYRYRLGQESPLRPCDCCCRLSGRSFHSAWARRGRSGYDIGRGKIHFPCDRSRFDLYGTLLFHGATMSQGFAIVSSSDSADPPHIAISVRNLRVNYGDREILHSIQFDVRGGETVVILGGSGSGKSTLLRALVGLEQSSGGEIWIRGRNFAAISERERDALCTKMGISFQNGALFGSMTVGENVALPLRENTVLDPSTIEIMVRLKLDQVGLAGFENYMPAQLSGGMKKRAAIARAMAMDPEILFFDEPSAGLDPIIAAGIDKLILKLKRTFRITMLVVTHELASAFIIADRMILIDKGNIVANGTPEDLRRANILAFANS